MLSTDYRTESSRQPPEEKPLFPFTEAQAPLDPWGAGHWGAGACGTAEMDALLHNIVKPLNHEKQSEN